MSKANASASLVLVLVSTGLGAQRSNVPRTDCGVEQSINRAVLPIPFGPRAAIDGQVSTAEWATANLVRFSFEDVRGDSVTANVWLMHDGESLQAAYVFERQGDGIWCAPELFVDSHNDRSATLRSDDWWFHVSGSDCAAAGRFDDYSTCTLSADWETGPKPAERGDEPPLRAFEVRIPFSKLGVSAGSEIGLGFRIMHSARVSGESIIGTAFWPPQGSPDNPSTWATAQLGSGES